MSLLMTLGIAGAGANVAGLGGADRGQTPVVAADIWDDIIDIIEDILDPPPDDEEDEPAEPGDTSPGEPAEGGGW